MTLDVSVGRRLLAAADIPTAIANGLTPVEWHKAHEEFRAWLHNHAAELLDAADLLPAARSEMEWARKERGWADDARDAAIAERDALRAEVEQPRADEAGRADAYLTAAVYLGHLPDEYGAPVTELLREAERLSPGISRRPEQAERGEQ